MATNSENSEAEFYYGGKIFVILERGWVWFKTGDEYMVTLEFQCHQFQVRCTCYESDEKTAMACASAELYQLVLSHQSRCINCQADIVSGLLSRRRSQETQSEENHSDD